MRCPACGVEVVDQSVYCHKCGERVVGIQPDVSEGYPVADVPRATPVEAFRRAGASAAEAGNPPEEELWRGGYSPKAMITHWIAAGMATVLILFVAVFFRSHDYIWSFSLLVILGIWMWCLILMAYRRLSVRYALTTQRFVHESGILRRVNDRIEVIDMDDITYIQDFFERLVGVGTIKITSSDPTHPKLDIVGIDNVKAVSELFDNARRKERRLRGLHVEQI